MTRKKGAAHTAWLDALKSRPRSEAARLIAERYPELSESEVQRRLNFIDTPPKKPAKPEPPKLPYDVAEARKAARLAEVKKGRHARLKDGLEMRLAAEARKARRDLPRR